MVILNMITSEGFFSSVVIGKILSNSVHLDYFPRPLSYCTMTQLRSLVAVIGHNHGITREIQYEYNSDLIFKI